MDFNTHVSLSRVSGAMSATGERTLSAPMRVAASIVGIKSFVKATANSQPSWEQAGETIILLHPTANVTIGDKVIAGDAALRVSSIQNRWSTLGILDHIEIGATPWGSA